MTSDPVDDNAGGDGGPHMAAGGPARPLDDLLDACKERTRKLPGFTAIDGGPDAKDPMYEDRPNAYVRDKMRHEGQARMSSMPDPCDMPIDVTVPADFAEKVAAELAKNNRFPVLTSTPTDPNPLAEMWRESVRRAGPGQVLSNAFEVRNRPFELTPADVVAACRTATAMCEEARKLIDRAVDTIRRATEAKAADAARLEIDWQAEQHAVAAEARYQAEVQAKLQAELKTTIQWPAEFGQFPPDPNLGRLRNELADAPAIVVEHKENP